MKELIKKQLTISHCFDCKYHRHVWGMNDEGPYFDNYCDNAKQIHHNDIVGDFCGAKKLKRTKKLKEAYHIPEWCPLEDVKP